MELWIWVLLSCAAAYALKVSATCCPNRCSTGRSYRPWQRR